MKAKDPNIVLKPLIAEMLIARMVRARVIQTV